MCEKRYESDDDERYRDSEAPPTTTHEVDRGFTVVQTLPTTFHDSTPSVSPETTRRALTPNTLPLFMNFERARRMTAGRVKK